MASPNDDATNSPVVNPPATAPTVPSAAPDPYDYNDELPPAAGTTPPAVRAAPAVVPLTGQPAADASTPPASTHPAWLVRRAEQHGLSEDEIRDMSTDALRGNVAMLDRHLVAIQQELSRSHVLTNQERAQAPAPQPPAAPVAPEDAFDLGMEPEQLEHLDPTLVRTIRRLGHTQAQKIAALEKQLAEVSTREQVREQDSVRARLDRLFDGIAATHGQYFGQGDHRKLTAAQMTERRKVTAAMKAFGKTYQELNMPIDEQELFDTAINGLYRGQVQAAPPASAPAADLGAAALEQRREEWSKAGTAAPVNQRTQLPKGTARATQTAARMMQEQGILSDDAEEMNGFLGN